MDKEVTSVDSPKQRPTGKINRLGEKKIINFLLLVDYEMP